MQWQALTFYKVKKLTVKDLQIQNAQQIQVSFERCVSVDASDLRVTAPGDSPNTDGVHITRTENMQLSSSVIKTGVFFWFFGYISKLFCIPKDHC